MASPRKLDQLPTKAREDYPRRPLGHRLERVPERQAGGDRREGVVEVVRLGERQLEALLAGGGRDERLGLALLGQHPGRLDVAAGSEAEQPRRSLEVRLERPGVGRHDRRAARAAARR